MWPLGLIAVTLLASGFAGEKASREWEVTWGACSRTPILVGRWCVQAPCQHVPYACALVGLPSASISICTRIGYVRDAPLPVQSWRVTDAPTYSGSRNRIDPNPSFALFVRYSIGANRNTSPSTMSLIC